MTVDDRMRATGGVTTGFDYLRILLALAVVIWHSIFIATGSHELDARLWTGPLNFLPAAIIPLFFALSGFLVAGSLLRSKLHHFVLLRVLRLAPALTVEITLSALVIGLAFTTWSWGAYLTDPMFFRYFLNIVGYIHYELPGVFADNPFPHMVNFQLWTIPFELECYIALIALLLLRMTKARLAFVVLVTAAAIGFTVRAWLSLTPIDAGHVTGRAVVLCFLAGVGLYLYRERVRYSATLGILSVLAAAGLLHLPQLSFLACLPIAYITVWLGLMNPPRIPFGDLSYGVYLFHYPIEQSVIHLWPWMNSWWQVSLVSLPPTLLCAVLSWNLIEHPILRRKRRILNWVDARAAALRGRKPVLAGLSAEVGQPPG